jgi:hypothetical protein
MDGSWRLEHADVVSVTRSCAMALIKVRYQIGPSPAPESMARLFHAARHIRTTAMSGIAIKYCHSLVILAYVLTCNTITSRGGLSVYSLH